MSGIRSVSSQSGHRSPNGSATARRVRWRAVGVGVVLTVWINAFDPIARYLVRSSFFTDSHLPFALLFGVLAVAFAYNPWARRWRPAWALDRCDLAGVLAIGFLGSTVPTLAQRFVAVVSAPEYFASPENAWPTYVLPNLRGWLVPSDAEGGVRMFYQGLRPGASVPWEIWLLPLFWWFCLLGSIMLGCLCLSVILRKQWSEHERLAFPLVELPLLLVQDPEPGRWLPRFFRERLFWIGFAVPALMLSWNMLGYFDETLPTFAFLNTTTELGFGRDFPTLLIRFDLYVFCFAYFTNRNILLSIWLFHVLASLQVGVTSQIGLWAHSPEAGLVSQCNYGLAAFVLWGLWVARRHFRDVCRKAIGWGADVDDSGELLSYRAALLGLAFSGLYVFLWMCSTGMGPWVAAAFLFFSLVLYVGMAKIVALSGLVSLRGSDPCWQTKELVGVQNMTDASIAALNQMGALYGNAKGFAMPGAVHSAKAAEQAAPERRRLGGAILVGGLLSLPTFVALSLLLGYYGPGAENFGDYSYTEGNRHFFNSIVSDIRNRGTATRDWWNMGFGAFGVAMTVLLTVLNQRLPWWPLHPVGFVVSCQYPTRASFFSVLVAWLVKSAILRLGGARLYNQCKPLVLGALMGYTLAVAVSFGLDLLFFMGHGHAIHAPPM